jgi:CelD/BcsL family acetyltransferase involved in cellulose biosynthesis
LGFEIVTDEDAFLSLEPEWRDLLSRVRQRNFFRTFDWSRRSWEYIARPRGQELLVVVGMRAGTVVLILPLARYRRLVWRTAEWIGGEHAYLQDVLVEDAPEAEAWIEAAWSLATKHVDFMWLNCMTDDAALAPRLSRVAGVRKDVEEAPYVDWADWPDWETYFRKRSKSVRKSLGRRRRRLEEQGKLEFRLATSGEEVGETLTWMFRRKTAWMKSKGVRMQGGGVDTADTQAFYRAFVADAFASDNLRLATLTLDGNVLAGELGLSFEGTLVAFMSVYDPAWEKYAPGNLLLMDLLRWSLENDGAIFDLMPYGEDYKYVWTSKDAAISTYLIPCSRWGRVWVAWRRSRLGATVRRLFRLRPADLVRVLRKRMR